MTTCHLCAGRITSRPSVVTFTLPNDAPVCVSCWALVQAHLHATPEAA